MFTREKLRIVVAPDSFKGSLSSSQAGEIIKKAFLLEIPQVEIDVVPLADGGEGTVDAFLIATNGERIELSVTAPTGEQVSTYYGFSRREELAVLEVANIAGYSMVSKERLDPFRLTTVGMGECIKHALDLGIKHMIIGLGGSATNDGGLGMLHALGIKFYNQAHELLPPIPSSLAQVQYVDDSMADTRLKDVSILVASDVNNPLCGVIGASAIFGPQKGATPAQIEELDRALAHYAHQLEKYLNRKLQDIPGAGAAGGLGFALLAIGAKIESGAALMAEITRLNQKLSQAKYLITGEGRTDGQTLQGKLPYTLALQAKELGVPTILISGSVAGELEPFYEIFESIHSIAYGPISLAESVANAEYLLYHQARNIARLIRNL